MPFPTWAVGLPDLAQKTLEVLKLKVVSIQLEVGSPGSYLQLLECKAEKTTCFVTVLYIQHPKPGFVLMVDMGLISREERRIVKPDFIN